MTGLQLYLLRHGEPDLKDGFYGHEDLHLSPLGQQQAAAQARALAGRPLRAIYCSDLRRASEGAGLLAADDDRPTPVALPALREMHLGVLERVGFGDARVRYPELVARRYEDMLEYRMPGGGESVQDVAARVLPCVHALIAEQLAACPERQSVNVAIVAHNTVNRILLACAAGLGPAGFIRFDQSLGSISRIDIRTWDPETPWNGARIGVCNWLPEVPA